VPPRKERVAVVLDTNVLLGFYLSRSKGSPNGRVFRMWRDRRKLQLILSRQLVDEYLEVLSRLNLLDISAAQRKRFRFEIVTPGQLLARLEE
jgi:predicted nucleic acid-binding protein